MSEKDNGGPAFPLQSIGPEFPPGYAGMTLRDHFAGLAMQAMVNAAITTGSLLADDDYAGDAYQLADAMLKARGN